MKTLWRIGEVFNHTDTDGTKRHFVIPLLRQSILDSPGAWSEITMPIDAALAAFVVSSGGVEEARIKAFPFSKIDEPGIGCLFADGTLLLVDGNHRLVKRVRFGLKMMKIMAGRPAVWESCLADPKTLLNIT